MLSGWKMYFASAKTVRNTRKEITQVIKMTRLLHNASGSFMRLTEQRLLSGRQPARFRMNLFSVFLNHQMIPAQRVFKPCRASSGVSAVWLLEKDPDVGQVRHSVPALAGYFPV